MIKRTVVGLLLTCFAVTAFAHSGVKNMAVMARMDGMVAISEGLKVMGTMVKGEIAFDAEKARAAATEIASHAAEAADLFEAPETDPKSEALPAIWENFADFTRKAEEMERVATQVSASIETMDDARSALAALGETCKSCHSLYRE